MSDAFAEWNSFFAPHGRGVERVFRIVRKRGAPLLLLPPRAATAAQCLALYPAQTLLARAARAALRLALLARVPLPRVRLPWDAAAPLPVFLREQSGGAEPEFGILFGNPRAEGRRWIIALFSNGQPHRVVKAGVTLRARELIAAEAACLAALPPGFPGAPIARGTLGDTALALDFAPGAPPEGNVEHHIGALLSRWLDSSRGGVLADVPAWRRVRASPAAPELIARVEREFGAEKFAATVMHGDFAPWNIRAHGGVWTVLDWERGELIGVPGWDWLHYAIQCEVLVARRPAADVLARVDALMQCAEFRAFAASAGIAGRERAVLLGYLLHAVEVVGQTEGAEVMRELLRLTCAGK